MSGPAPAPPGDPREPSQPSGSAGAARGRTGPILAPCAALALAAVPSALVVAHQWLGRASVSKPFADLWQQAPFFQQLEWPPYFAAVLISCLGLLLFFLIRSRDPCPWSPGPPTVREGRNRSGSRVGGALVFLSCAVGLATLARAVVAGRIPGWELLGVLLLYATGKLLSEIRARALLRLWRARVAVALPLVALHVCLIGWLADHFFGKRPGTIWLAGALVSGLCSFARGLVSPSRLGSSCSRSAWAFSSSTPGGTR